MDPPITNPWLSEPDVSTPFGVIRGGIEPNWAFEKNNHSQKLFKIMQSNIENTNNQLVSFRAEELTFFPPIVKEGINGEYTTEEVIVRNGNEEVKATLLGAAIDTVWRRIGHDDIDYRDVFDGEHAPAKQTVIMPCTAQLSFRIRRYYRDGKEVSYNSIRLIDIIPMNIVKEEVRA